MLAMFHKAEACRLINERFTTGEGALSDAALGAVLYLIATEASNARMKIQLDKELTKVVSKSSLLEE
jgi:hypothetical protein